MVQSYFGNPKCQGARINVSNKRHCAKDPVKRCLISNVKKIKVCLFSRHQKNLEKILSQISGRRVPYQRAIILCGWLFIGASIVTTVTVAVGLVGMETFSFKGVSGIRTIAGMAVFGCLLSALGYMNEEQQLDD
jgi:hypothetical protein